MDNKTKQIVICLFFNEETNNYIVDNVRPQSKLRMVVLF